MQFGTAAFMWYPNSRLRVGSPPSKKEKEVTPAGAFAGEYKGEVG